MDSTGEERASFFEVCGRCYPHLASERAFKSALRRAVEGREAPPELRGRVLELLDEAADER